jgi:hypothetical protein
LRIPHPGGRRHGRSRKVLRRRILVSTGETRDVEQVKITLEGESLQTKCSFPSCMCGG